ncbi:MAG: hypothetical protein ACI841_001772 [Planctomycetota bacterium]
MCHDEGASECRDCLSLAFQLHLPSAVALGKWACESGGTREQLQMVIGAAVELEDSAAVWPFLDAFQLI